MYMLPILAPECHHDNNNIKKSEPTGETDRADQGGHGETRADAPGVNKPAIPGSEGAQDAIPPNQLYPQDEEPDGIPAGRKPQGGAPGGGELQTVP